MIFEILSDIHLEFLSKEQIRDIINLIASNKKSNILCLWATLDILVKKNIIVNFCLSAQNFIIMISGARQSRIL